MFSAVPKALVVLAGATTFSSIVALAGDSRPKQIVNKEFRQGETIFKFSWGSVEIEGVGTTGKFYGPILVGLVAKNLKGKQVGKPIEITEGKPVTLFIQKNGIFINADGVAAEGFSCLISGQPFGKEADLVQGTLYSISCSGGNPIGQTATLQVSSQSK